VIAVTNIDIVDNDML